MRRKANLSILGTVLIVLGAQQVHAFASDEAKSTTAPKLSTSDTYIDLGTGKEFRILYDDLNDIYNRNDLFALELYVNTRTRDTFWLEDAILINNALLKDEGGNYRVDPNKVKRNGNTYMVKANVVQPAAKPAAAAPAVKPAPTAPAPAAAVQAKPTPAAPAASAPVQAAKPIQVEAAPQPAVAAPAIATPAEPATPAAAVAIPAAAPAGEPNFMQMELPANATSSQTTTTPANAGQVIETK